MPFLEVGESDRSRRHPPSRVGAEDVPADNADLARLTVESDRLTPDSVTACPVPVEDLLEYLADEVPDGESLTNADLTFLRTARLSGTDYWVWRFAEPGTKGGSAYATVSKGGQGSQPRLRGRLLRPHSRAAVRAGGLPPGVLTRQVSAVLPRPAPRKAAGVGLGRVRYEEVLKPQDGRAQGARMTKPLELDDLARLHDDELETAFSDAVRNALHAAALSRPGTWSPAAPRIARRRPRGRSPAPASRGERRP